MTSEPQTVLITGATSGIGRSTAYLLAGKGYRLILCGRRSERLIEIKKELDSQAEILILTFDVSNRLQVEESLLNLPDPWKKIDVLINNAGNAYGFSPIQTGNIDDWDAMIDINVKGLLYVSRSILPAMIERKSGQIINIGSIAGKEVYPGGNVYCASKYAVDAITQGMRIDLNDYNIRVCAINPGMVRTEFSLVRFKGDKEKADSPYSGMEPLLPEDIAEIIYFIITRPQRVSIADLLVFPVAQASAVKVNRNGQK